MYARVVRFTDIKPEQLEEIQSQAGESGPPPGVPAKAIKIVVDQTQGTAVAIVFFETEENLRQGDEALDAMDAADTPGTRVSVDQGEVMVDLEVG